MGKKIPVFTSSSFLTLQDFKQENLHRIDIAKWNSVGSIQLMFSLAYMVNCKKLNYLKHFKPERF